MAEAAQTVESNTQSAGTSGSIEDLAMIEEHVDAGLLDLLDEYNPPPEEDDPAEKDLAAHYSIDTKQALSQFDTGGAKAYAAKAIENGNSNLVGLICDPHIPNRKNAFDEIRGLTHPNLFTLHDSGNMHIAELNERRRVLIVDRPQGRKLLDVLMTQSEPMHERQVIDQIITPIAQALYVMHEKGVSHGRVNPDNIYWDQKVVLGECLSEPQGWSQHHLYEPLERLLCTPIGKGSATTKSDAYALGMLAYEALYGLSKFRDENINIYRQGMLKYGSYNILIGNKDVSDSFVDFFRGIFVDDKQERWGLEHILQWVSGKRYNLVVPSVPKEASRPFTFNDTEYYNSRELAHALAQNWQLACKQMRDSKLDRWLEMSAHKKDKAEAVYRILSNFSPAGTESANSESLCRLIIALDPAGPMRSKNIAVNVDGLGLAFAHFYQQKDHAALEQLMNIIKWDIPSFWADTTHVEKTSATNSTIYSLQQIRLQSDPKKTGFGIERLIYDLNPTLACQSDWLIAYHLTTAEAALKKLDNLSKTRGRDNTLLDRHLAAFLASRVGISKESKFSNLLAIPKLKNNPELACMNIIATAQDKSGKIKLPGLAAWSAIRVDKMIENIHSRKLRKSIKLTLKQAAKSALVRHTLAALVGNELTKSDNSGFERAHHLYDYNEKKIEALKNRKLAEQMAEDLGGRMAVFIAYLILSITIYILVDHYII